MSPVSLKVWATVAGEVNESAAANTNAEQGRTREHIFRVSACVDFIFLSM
jgi:hypothetical protein